MSIFTYQTHKVITYAAIAFLIISCSREIKNNESNQDDMELGKKTEHEIGMNDDKLEKNIPEHFINQVENTMPNNTNGLITEDGLRIRSYPSINAEILGKLNSDGYVSILAATQEKQRIDNSLDYWYKIKTENDIIGWIFGNYLYILRPDEPVEFANNKWYRAFGEMLPDDGISITDLQSTSWHTGYTYLLFSKKGNYAIGERWTGPQYGVYEFSDNTVSFNPPFEYFVNSVKYQIDRLYYSNEMHFGGTPVLKNIDENLEFYPSVHLKPKTGETVKINGYYCTRIREDGTINTDGILYSLPDIKSRNVFADDYFGAESIKAKIVKLARVTIDDVVWYYTLFDFTGGEPTDGGGPFYEGWLQEEYFE